MRQRKCKACGERFMPTMPLQQACSLDCAIKVGRKAHTAKVKKADMQKRISLKTRSDWLKEAQKAFNAYIRARDQLADHPCISSGRTLDWSGNSVDAGHYRSTGSAPHLRFDERNCHAQSKADNRYLAGNAVDYRIGLIKRIGLAAVEDLEADQEPRKWSIEELREIAAKYKKLAKEIIFEINEKNG